MPGDTGTGIVMYLNVNSPVNSCSFCFTFGDVPGDPEWAACTASLRQAGSSPPLVLRISSEWFGESSYAVTPLGHGMCLITDMENMASCTASLASSCDDIALSIEDITGDEELAELVAYALSSLCCPGCLV